MQDRTIMQDVDQFISIVVDEAVRRNSSTIIIRLSGNVIAGGEMGELGQVPPGLKRVLLDYLYKMEGTPIQRNQRVIRVARTHDRNGGFRLSIK